MDNPILIAFICMGKSIRIQRLSTTLILGIVMKLISDRTHLVGSHGDNVLRFTIDYSQDMCLSVFFSS